MKIHLAKEYKNREELEHHIENLVLDVPAESVIIEGTEDELQHFQLSEKTKIYNVRFKKIKQ